MCNVDDVTFTLQFAIVLYERGRSFDMVKYSKNQTQIRYTFQLIIVINFTSRDSELHWHVEHNSENRVFLRGTVSNAITCERIDPASFNLVCGFFMERSRMSAHLGHLDLLSRSLRSPRVSACEHNNLIIDPASPNSVCGFFY